MTDELLLKVKVDIFASGELVLEHFRTSIDDVKAISESHEFGRKQEP